MKVRTFCAGCHATPEPSLFPKDAWHSEVVRGYRFYAQAGRHDLDPPPIQEAVRYYIENAPEELVMPKPAADAVSDGSQWFDTTPISVRSPFQMQ